MSDESDPREELRSIVTLATDLMSTATYGDLALCSEDLTEARETLTACVGYIAERARRRAA